MKVPALLALSMVGVFGGVSSSYAASADDGTADVPAPYIPYTYANGDSGSAGMEACGSHYGMINGNATCTLSTQLGINQGFGLFTDNSTEWNNNNTYVIGSIDGHLWLKATAGVTMMNNVLMSGNQINQLAAGTADTDAVNVSQLKGVTQAIGGGATVSGDGSITPPTYKFDDGSLSYNNAGDAFNLIAGRIKYFHVNSTAAGSTAAGAEAIGIGPGASAAGDNSIALGDSALTANSNSVAIGNKASALVSNSVALGANSVAARTNSVSVGAQGSERQIINVAAGSAGTDAVNMNQLNAAIASAGGVDAVLYDSTSHNKVSLGGTSASSPVTLANVADGKASNDAVNVEQLKAMGASIDTSGHVTGAFVAYDSTARNSVTLGGAGTTTPVALTNVKAGAVSSSSVDAVNGSQLYNTANSVAAALGGGSSVDTTGKVVKPAYALDGNTYTDVGAALAAVDAKAGTGSSDGVKYDTSAHDKVTFGGTISATPVTLANVADGKANNDAVNVEQLKAMGASIDTSGHVTGAFVAYDSTAKNSVNLGGVGATTPVALTNVKTGAVSSSSTDAVNGSQLYNTAGSVAAALGGGSSVDASGKVTKPTYGLSSGTFNDVGSALGSLDSSISSMNNTIADTTKYIKVVSGSSAAIASGGESVAIGGGAYASGADAMAFGFGSRAQFADSVALGSNSVATVANTISVGSKGSERRIMNVANGQLGTDAATVAQLTALQSQLTQQTNGVKSMLQSGGTLLGATPVTNYIAVSTLVTTGQGSGTSTDNSKDAMAIGPVATALGAGSLAIGAQSGTALANSTAIGTAAAALSLNTTVIGAGASTSGSANNAVAIGYNANAQNTDALALGAGSQSNAAESVALGSNSFVATGASNSMAIGSNATVNAGIAGAVAIGYNSVADRANAISVGSSTSQRQVINVAAGTANTDAVNVKQLSSVTAAIGGGTGVNSDGTIKAPSFTIGGKTYTDVGSALVAAAATGSSSDSVAYDTTSHTKVTLGGTGSTTPVTLANVADGKLNNDAVNVEQLKAMGANIDSSGNISNAFVAYDSTSKDKVTFGGTGSTTPVTLANVADGKANNDAVNVEQLKAMGANIDSSGNISNAFVSYDDTSKSAITLKGATGTKISGLAEGTLSATSTDAVNGTQLYLTNQNVANVAGNVTNLTNVVNNITNGSGAGIKYFHANSTLADSSATGADAVAIGGNAKATAGNSVALGANSTTTTNLIAPAYMLSSGTLSGITPAGEVSVGSAGKERRLTNVAAGAAATDAVNVSQLQAAVTQSASSSTADAVMYDSSAHDKITLGGATGLPVTLTNLAAGAVTTSSKDAINGAQLYNTANTVANALGGGAGVDADGGIKKPSYALSSGTYTDVGSALGAIDSSVSSINNNIAETTKYIKVVSGSSAAIASGGEAVAIGGGAYASGLNSLAIGAGSRSQFGDSVALGSNSVATVENTISVGSRGSERRIMNVANGTLATDAATFGQLSALQNQLTQQTTGLKAELSQQESGVKSMLQGASLLGDALPVTSYIAVSSNLTPGLPAATATGKDSMAIGPGATALGDTSVAVGTAASTFQAYSTVVGSGAVSASANTTVIGSGASTSAKADSAVAIGYNSNAEANNALALGTSAQVDANAANGVALGANAYAKADGSMALGANSLSDRANTISVGTAGAERQIVNVAAGTQDTDAVNLSQMNAAIASVAGGGSADAVIYDTSAHNKLTLGGKGTTNLVGLTNVAAGQITSSSSDAVNGTQLFNTASSVAAALGGNSAVGTDGKLSKPTYTLGTGTYSDVGSALSAVAAMASGGGSADAVVYDTSAHDQLTLGGAKSTVPVTLANVADGKANNDAVNVQQLKAMGANIDSSGNVTGAFVAYDDSLKSKVTLGGAGSTVPVILTNVAVGQVTSSSRDAINGSQLYGAMTSAATALGGNTTVGTDGKLSKPTYTLDGNTFNDVGSALAAVDAKATTGSTNGVVYDSSLHNKLTLGGADSSVPVQLSNVADAKADGDAVNLRQLKEAGLNVDPSGNVTNSFIAYDDSTKGTVTFNAGGAPTQLKNVASATDLTDAVNFGQMQKYVADNAGSGGGTANAVAYDDSTKSRVTLGGAGSSTPVTLTNVAAGSTATDAVNYSQFSSLQSQVNNLAGGGAGNTTFVNINVPADGGTAAVASGSDSIAIGNGAAATGATSIAIGKDTVTSGDNSVAMGAGASAPNTNAVALGANSTTDRDNSVSVGSAGAERQITNVAAGTQGTDAVNLNQLNNAMGGMSQSIQNVDRSAAKGIASASALNIVTPYLPGRTTVNAGVSNYRGFQAVGLGVSRWNEKGTINYNLGVSTSGGNSTIVRAGIGIVLGN